jgi:hypothetical protein
MDPDRLIDLLVELLAPLDVLGREPDPQSFVPHPGVESLGEVLILRAVADEARIELDRVHLAEERRQVGDQRLGHAAAAEERLGDLLPGADQRIHADGARPFVLDRLEALHPGEIDVPEDRASACCRAEVGLVEVGPAEVGPAEVGPAEEGTHEVGPAEVGIAEVGPAEVGPAEVGPAEVGPTEVGPAEVGPAEVGLDEVGPAEVGPVEVGPAEVGPAEVGPVEFGDFLTLPSSPIPLADPVRPALEQSDGFVAVHGVAPSEAGLRRPKENPAPALYLRAGITGPGTSPGVSGGAVERTPMAPV